MSITMSEYRKQKNPVKNGTRKPVKKRHYDVIGSITMSDKHIEFSWEGKDISLNEWYSSKHWSERKKRVIEWHVFFKSFLIKPYPALEKYEISLEYNSNIDTSNCITMIKLYEDMMQEEKIIPNDNKLFCKKITLMPNLDMNHKSYKITVNAI